MTCEKDERCDRKTRARWGLDLFLNDEGGFTTVAVAAALLVSLALVFSVARAQWGGSRAADVQAIADASAMAGEDMVAAYTTVAQVLDASLLSMGLLGVIALGVGTVLCAIPPAAASGAEVLRWGTDVLAKRNDFAKGCAQGLSRFEQVMPGLIMANSAAVVAANSGELVRYGGCAVPFPTKSESDFGSLLDDASGNEMQEIADEVRDAAQEAEEAKQKADGLKEQGWRADCGNDGRCMRERAEALAGLSGGSNPHYALEAWNFGVPLARARTYYAARRSAEEGMSYADPHEIRDSACRKAFYAYALSQVNAGSYAEDAEGYVTSCSLPSLPRNTEQMRTTTLYTDARWPVGGGIFHASAACPAYTDPQGFASVKQLEAGEFKSCESCGMSAFYLGQVASATTNTDVGFEHWWREVVGASLDYQQARNKQVDAEKRLKEAEEKADEAFEDLIEQLNVRPKLCPPGAWGCVGITIRSSADVQMGPSVFAANTELPAGAALSASTLAPDDHTEENDVLSSFFDALCAGDEGPSIGGVLDGVVSLWGRLLKGYGAAAEKISDVADSVFALADLLPAGGFAKKLSKTFKAVTSASGLAAADLRLRKPVLVNSAQVLSKAGMDADNLRTTVQSLPDDAGPVEVARAFALHYMDTGDIPETLTLAELSLPGTNIQVPLSINLRELLGAS